MVNKGILFLFLSFNEMIAIKGPKRSCGQVSCAGLWFQVQGWYLECGQGIDEATASPASRPFYP